MADYDPKPNSILLGFSMAYSKEGRGYLYDVGSLGIVRFPQTPVVTGGGPVNYEMATPVGGSASHMDFASTANPTVSIRLEYNRHMLSHAYPTGKTLSVDEAHEHILDVWRTLESFKYPTKLYDEKGDPLAASSGEASLLVLGLPNILEWYCRMTDFRWEVRKKDVRGRLVHVTFNMTFQEDPDRRWLAEGVRYVGNFRT